MSQGIVNIRMDETLKRNFDYICEELGMNMSTAITIFAKKVCREKRIPFEISLNDNIESERMSAMPKTIYRVSVWTNYECEEWKNIQKDFDDFEEAYYYIREEVNNLDDKKMRMLGENDDFAKSTTCFGIEFINSQNMYRKMIRYDDEFIYEHDNMEEDIYDIVPEGGDHLDSLYSFVKALQL